MKSDTELMKAYRDGRQSELTDEERDRLHHLPQFRSERIASLHAITQKGDAKRTSRSCRTGDAEKELRAAGLIPEDAATFVTRQIEEPVWIVPDLIAKHYQCALYGKSKSKKTFFGLQLALSVATGTPFLKWQIDQPHSVCYFNLELMPYFMQERMRKQCASEKIERPSNLTIFNLRGHANLLRETVELGDASPLMKYIRQKNVALCVVDPRYKLMQGQEDENTAAGLRALLDFRTALADACAVLLIGHDPKGDVSNKSLLDRGAGSYTAIADDDATILLTPNANADEGVDAVTVETIHRNRPAIQPFAATFDADSLTFAADDSISAVTSIGRSPTKMSNGEKAQRNAEKYRLFVQAAIEVADEHGDNLIDCGTFKAEMSIKANGTVFGATDSKAFRDAWKLITEGEGKMLMKCDKLERKTDGSIGKPKKRVEYVSTVERIVRYLEKWKPSEQGGK